MILPIPVLVVELGLSFPSPVKGVDLLKLLGRGQSVVVLILSFGKSKVIFPKVDGG